MIKLDLSDLIVTNRYSIFVPGPILKTSVAGQNCYGKRINCVNRFTLT